MNICIFTILSNVLLFIPIKKIISLKKIDNDFLFIILSNIIFQFSIFCFFKIYHNIIISFYLAFFLMIFAYLLIYNIKNILGKYQIYSLPYFIFNVYIFVKILIIYLF